ncbi:hypothetical protein QF045_004673 [Pseudomonas sp. W4I3]|nr:hypothetical protein [Pseudomonas sp. W4I3]
MDRPTENRLPALFERPAMSFSGKPTALVEHAIENDGFWPDLSVSEFQKEQRLPAEYLVELLVDTLKSAMVEVNTDLARVKATLQDAGVSNLTAAAGLATPAEWAYANKVALYKRAVYCRAKGHSLPQFATVTRRERALKTPARKRPSVRKPSWLSASRPCVPSRAVAASRRHCCDPAAGADRLPNGSQPRGA